MSGRRTEGGFSGLRAAALIAALVGAVGAVGFLLRTTGRNPSHLLVALLVIWVLSPFIVLLAANIASTRWSALTRWTISGVTLAVTLGTLAIYEADALWPRGSQRAFVFIVVPPASWLLSALGVSLAVFGPGRRSRRAEDV